MYESQDYLCFESCLFNRYRYRCVWKWSFKRLSGSPDLTVHFWDNSKSCAASPMILFFIFLDPRLGPVCVLPCFYLLSLQRQVFLPNRLTMNRMQFHSLSSGPPSFWEFQRVFTANNNEENTGGKMTYQRKVTKFQIRSNRKKKSCFWLSLACKWQ